MAISNFIFVISATFVLWTVKRTLNKHYGQICDIALRQKLVDDIIGIIFFIVSMTYMIKNSSINIMICCAAIIVAIVYLLFGSYLYKKIKKLLKSNKGKVFSVTDRNDSDETLDSRWAIYKETIFLAIILFCKRTIFLFWVIVAFSVITTFVLGIFESISYKENFELILKQFQFDKISINILFIFAVVGFMISIKKYVFNIKMSNEDKDDNLRYYKIINKLQRKEHDI